MTDDHTALLVRVTGRVQGVGYRIWTRTEATRLGLDGWVRNEDDGAVSALLVGPAAAVSAMVERLRRGPPGAAVASVVSQAADSEEHPPGFRIVR